MILSESFFDTTTATRAEMMKTIIMLGIRVRNWSRIELWVMDTLITEPSSSRPAAYMVLVESVDE